MGAVELKRATRVEHLPTLPYHLYPLHPDTQNRFPAMVTNGSDWKAPLARSIGCPIINDLNIKVATNAAEDEFHAEFGKDALGPVLLHGSPYQLLLADVKLEAGKKILEKDNKLESFFTSDTTYRLMIDGSDVNFTIHKPKTKEDREKITRLLADAALSGNAHLAAVAGIVRYDEVSKEKEYYTTELDLGIVQPFDITILVNRLEQNASKPLGTSTFDIPDFLVERQPFYKMKITKYDLDKSSQILLAEKNGDLRFDERLLQLKPTDRELEKIGIYYSNSTLHHKYMKTAETTIDISGDNWAGNNVAPWIHIAGLGLISS